jgi:hypothetical protein
MAEAYKLGLVDHSAGGASKAKPVEVRSGYRGSPAEKPMVMVRR